MPGAGGYDIGANISPATSSAASNNDAFNIKGGGVQFVFADQGSTASGSSSSKSLLTIVGLVAAVALVGFVAWRLVK